MVFSRSVFRGRFQLFHSYHELFFFLFFKTPFILIIHHLASLHFFAYAQLHFYCAQSVWLLHCVHTKGRNLALDFFIYSNFWLNFRCCIIYLFIFFLFFYKIDPSQIHLNFKIYFFKNILFPACDRTCGSPQIRGLDSVEFYIGLANLRIKK